MKTIVKRGDTVRNRTGSLFTVWRYMPAGPLAGDVDRILLRSSYGLVLRGHYSIDLFRRGDLVLVKGGRR